MKIAIVVQRCGEGIAAGAEAYSLNLSKALAQYVSVDVLTSASSDYIRWNNEMPETTIVGGSTFPVVIKRFPVKHSRWRIVFGITKRISFFLNQELNFLYKLLAPLLDHLFLRSQGPWCPGLWATIKNSDEYDVFIFKSYLYAPVAKGLSAVPKGRKKVLIITAHNEAEFKLNFVAREIREANIIGYVSKAEKNLVNRIYPASNYKKELLLPPGINIVAHSTIPKLPLPEKYFLVVGRIDGHKNVDFLFSNCPEDCVILFAGDLKMPFPKDKRFIYAGKVTDSEKQYLIENCIAVLMVSRFEAYSMITAESLSLGKTVLALKGCGPVDELIASYGGLSLEKKDFFHWMGKLQRGDSLPRESLPNGELIREEKSWKNTVLNLISLVEEPS